jgi:hypothetical protein
MENLREEKTDDKRQLPPVFSTWSRLYAAVLLNLTLQVFLLYLFTKAFE